MHYSRCILTNNTHKCDCFCCCHANYHHHLSFSGNVIWGGLDTAEKVLSRAWATNKCSRSKHNFCRSVKKKKRRKKHVSINTQAITSNLNSQLSPSRCLQCLLQTPSKSIKTTPIPHHSSKFTTEQCSYLGSPSGTNFERIWPFCDLFGVLPHHVVFAEEEEGAVDR